MGLCGKVPQYVAKSDLRAIRLKKLLWLTDYVTDMIF